MNNLKKCLNCGIEKDAILEFHKKTHWCKKCCALAHQERVGKRKKDQANINILDVKICERCKKEKNIIQEFPLIGLICKDCVKLYKIQYNQSHKEEITKTKDIYNKEHMEETSIYNKKYRNEHKEEIKKQKQQWSKNNRPEINERKRILYHTNNNVRIHSCISSMIYKQLKNNDSSKNGESCLPNLDYSLDKFQDHLQTKYLFWMNKENRGSYNKETHDTNPTWQLDHIIPHSLFKYKTMDEPLFKICWSLENLRPLDAKQNHFDGINRVRHTQANKDLIKQKVIEYQWNQMSNFFSYEE